MPKTGQMHRVHTTVVSIKFFLSFFKNIWNAFSLFEMFVELIDFNLSFTSRLEELIS